MKRHYRRHLIQNLVSDPAVPVNDAIKAVTLKDAISFVDKAWRCVTDSHIRKVWTKSTLTDCFPSQAEDRDELEPEPELDSISAKIQEALEVSLCEVEEWMSCDSHDTQATQMMTDEAIIEYAKASAQKEEEEKTQSPNKPRSPELVIAEHIRA